MDRPSKTNSRRPRRNIKVGVTQKGEILTYSEPIPPLNCTDKYGNNFLGLIKKGRQMVL